VKIFQACGKRASVCKQSAFELVRVTH